jgi:hypothetical protein
MRKERFAKRKSRPVERLPIAGQEMREGAGKKISHNDRKRETSHCRWEEQPMIKIKDSLPLIQKILS